MSATVQEGYATANGGPYTALGWEDQSRCMITGTVDDRTFEGLDPDGHRVYMIHGSWEWTSAKQTTVKVARVALPGGPVAGREYPLWAWLAACAPFALMEILGLPSELARALGLSAITWLALNSPGGEFGRWGWWMAPVRETMAWSPVWYAVGPDGVIVTSSDGAEWAPYNRRDET